MFVTATTAALLTDSRYFIQAAQQLDPETWGILHQGSAEGEWKGWREYVAGTFKEQTVGMDATLLGQADATSLLALGLHLVFPPSNLVDRIKGPDAPAPTPISVHAHGLEYAGVEAGEKVRLVQQWVGQESAGGILVCDLSDIAWTLNLRARGMPYTPLFPAYLYIGGVTQVALLFVDKSMLQEGVQAYLEEVGVQVRPYDGVWAFLEGDEVKDKVTVITAQASYAISRALGEGRFVVKPNKIQEMKMVKNPVEITGMKNASTLR